MVAILFFLLKTRRALAASIIDDPWGGPVTSADSVTNLIQRVQIIVSAAAGIVAVGIVLYGAFLYLISGGDEQKAGKAKKVLTTGIVGAFIVIAAQIIITVFIAILGGRVS